MVAPIEEPPELVEGQLMPGRNAKDSDSRPLLLCTKLLDLVPVAFLLLLRHFTRSCRQPRVSCTEANLQTKVKQQAGMNGL